MIRFAPDILEVVKGSLHDYELLAEYHYRTEPIKPFTSIYKIRAHPPYTKAFPDPIAVIVYRMPLPDLRARTKATNGFFHKPPTLSARLKLVNKHIRYLARLIVDPRFQKLGLGTRLLTETLPHQTCSIVETLTPIDFTNRLFTKAGFELHYTSAPGWYNRFANFINTLGLRADYFLLPSTLQHRLDTMGPELNKLAEKEITAFIKHFRHRQFMPPGIERSKFLLSKMPFPKAYLIWHNPKNRLTR